jgi:CubicO group peptidase (beta-lactamase class C family)
MMRYRRWSTRSMIVVLFLAVSVACGAPPVGGPGTSVPPTAVVSSAVPPAAVGTSIDDYLAHGSVNLQNIRAVLVSQRGELLAERYYHSDAAAYAEIQSATKSVVSTLVGIALTDGDLKSLDQTLGELLPQHRSAMSKSSARTTVRQLLTMTGGWTAFYDADTATPELVRRVPKAGPEVDPGTFVYSNVGPHLLSAVLAQAAGMSALGASSTPTTSRRPPPIRSPSSRARSAATGISGGSHRWRRTAPIAPGQVRATDYHRARPARCHRDLLAHIG